MNLIRNESLSKSPSKGRIDPKSSSMSLFSLQKDPKEIDHPIPLRADQGIGRARASNYSKGLLLKNYFFILYQLLMTGFIFQ